MNSKPKATARWMGRFLVFVLIIGMFTPVATFVFAEREPEAQLPIAGNELHTDPETTEPVPEPPVEEVELPADETEPPAEEIEPPLLEDETPVEEVETPVETVEPTPSPESTVEPTPVEEVNPAPPEQSKPIENSPGVHPVGPMQVSYSYLVQSFFPATGNSTNDHFTVEGVFIGQDHNVYLILDNDKATAQQYRFYDPMLNGQAAAGFGLNTQQ